MLAVRFTDNYTVFLPYILESLESFFESFRSNVCYRSIFGWVEKYKKN